MTPTLNPALEVFRGLKANGWPQVEAWIAKQERESFHLDFKGVRDGDPLDGFRSIAAKAISGFANSDGGTLVFGLVTGKRDGVDHVASTQTFIENADAFSTWLSERVSAFTNPKVDGMQIFALRKSDSDARGVVALYIPGSDAKPHCVANKLEGEGRYYMRTDDRTMPMSHEMLGALFGQVPPPKLQLVAQWDGANGQPRLKLFLRNVGRGSARSPVVRVDHPAEQMMTLNTSDGGRQSVSLTGRSEFMTPAGFDNFHPGLDIRVGQFSIERTLRTEPGKVHLRGGIYADRMAAITFDREFSFSQNEEKIIAGGDDDEH